MFSNNNRGTMLDVTLPAFAPVDDTVTDPDTTPIVSDTIKVKGVDTIAFDIATTDTVDGTWSAEVSSDEADTKVWLDRAAMEDAPTWPTGTTQSATVTVSMLGFKFLRLTFTPIEGSGDVSAEAGVIVGSAIDLERVTLASVYLYTPGADDLEGGYLIEVSNNNTSAKRGNPTSDGRFTDIVAAGDPAVPGPTGTGQDLGVRLGEVEFGAMRISLTPTAGSGSASVYFQGK